MSEPSHHVARGPSHRLVEVGMALFMALLALIVIGGSIQVGYGWAFDGPQAGFFPFYLGLIILGASIVNLAQVRKEYPADMLFAEWGQLRQVVAVVVPTALYVTLVPWIGMYVASILLIAVFMKWLGKYGWGMVLPISIGVPLLTFIVFERWFLVPLPKGPIEDWLGF
jgi:hypothetical protein